MKVFWLRVVSILRVTRPSQAEAHTAKQMMQPLHVKILQV